MIRLESNCLLFQTANGESFPVSAETISVELAGAAAGTIDPELIQNAAAAAVHYFRHDLEQECVTAAEFAGALEKVLHRFGFEIYAVGVPGQPVVKRGNDLCRLAGEPGGELAFFQHLRQTLRQQLEQAEPTVRFHGLRSCVKRLAGAHRWSPRCDTLRDQIVDYLRRCLSAEVADRPCTLVVE
jgi:hypothetical protein